MAVPKKVVTLYVTQEEKDEIEEAATEEQRSINNFCTMIIRQYLDGRRVDKLLH